MLKISIIENPTGQTIVLEGTLTEAYLPELETAWSNARLASPALEFIVDLRNTTFIDRKSESVLLRMKRDGAQFVACGISTTHQLEQLGISCKKATSNVHSNAAEGTGLS
jgi:anti-anti-sigma regulatory factor